MVYILEQRLKAQKIQDTKSRKVLSDVVRSMYSPKFIHELFKPQDTYSNASTRQIFDRLAHSSIMRLNPSSMDKLYDLMTMGFKFQLLRSTCASDIIRITMNHLEALKAIVEDEAVCLLIDTAIDLTHKTYGSLSEAQFNSLKQALHRFFQDRRIKVSLYLQDGLQNMDATVVLPCGGFVPKGVNVPGKMKVYGSGDELLSETPFTYPLYDCVEHSTETPFLLGNNVYGKGRKSKTRKPCPGPNSIRKRISSGSSSSKGSSSTPSSSKTRPVPELKAVNVGQTEMNLLADLLGSAVTSIESKSDGAPMPPLALFKESKAASSVDEPIVFDEADQAYMSMLDEFKLEEDVSESKAVPDEDDLLSLMDSL
eukprot:TRINITY_DN777922_c0_g1_i1.p1 TRINITY_DN777922_c0_g1~~TRINITY_DN777922_c0_g1_i1.p1  ORF type:complete len:399 (+),score=120.06 TRINITY_DN777922_c0_g1_i1:96-1199(+)